MGTLLIDKLLHACVKQRPAISTLPSASRRSFVSHGHMRQLETKVLEPDDTVALMKSITPDRCQQELQEVGGCRLWLRLWRHGPVPRVDLQAARQRRRWCCGRFPTSC